MALQGDGRWVLALSTTLKRHFQISTGIHIGVANAVKVLDHRYRSFCHEARDEALAAARDEHYRHNRVRGSVLQLRHGRLWG